MNQVLAAQGNTSRIVHVEGPAGIHTLVEFREAGQWILADPQNNLLGSDWQRLSGRDVTAAPDRERPAEWHGFSRLYVHVPWRGYVRVTERNGSRFYNGEYP